jgi:hypothetical protein
MIFHSSLHVGSNPFGIHLIRPQLFPQNQCSGCMAGDVGGHWYGVAWHRNAFLGISVIYKHNNFSPTTLIGLQ